jgi:hypothetical protein
MAHGPTKGVSTLHACNPVRQTLTHAGILLAVGALEAAGLLQRLAVALSAAVPNIGVVAGAIGLVSALVDNVPLVAATMGMYDLTRVPVDSQLWQMIALCAGASLSSGLVCRFDEVAVAQHEQAPTAARSIHGLPHQPTNQPSACTHPRAHRNGRISACHRLCGWRGFHVD